MAGIFKEIATIFVSTTLFKDTLTPINISGLCVALIGRSALPYLGADRAGIALYNVQKWRAWRAATAVKSPTVPTGPYEPNGGLPSPSKPALYNMVRSRDWSSAHPQAQESGFFVAESRLSIDSDTAHTLGDDSDSDDGQPGDDDGAIRLLPRHRGPPSEHRVLDETLNDDHLKDLDREADALKRSMAEGIQAGESSASEWEHVLADGPVRR